MHFPKLPNNNIIHECVFIEGYITNQIFGHMQGHLDEQFIQLEELQDDANPNFVEEIVTLYYRDSSRLISSLEQTL